MSSFKRYTSSFVVVVCVAFVLLNNVANTSATLLRGVSPEKAHSYKETPTWKCLDGSASIRWNQLNDDFCDCADGSDEPGTSACSLGWFYCRNEGYLAASLRSSRVDDGVCDCCDGSDEKHGCANTCDEAGREWRIRLQREKEMQREGHSKYLELITAGVAARAALMSKIAELDVNIAQMKHQEAELKAALDIAEGPEKSAKEEFDKHWDGLAESAREQQRDAAFAKLDFDNDGMITLSDVQQHTAFDADEDGTVSIEEARVILDNDGDGATSETEAALNKEKFVETLFNELPSEIKGTVEVPAKPAYPDDIQALIEVANSARDAHRGVADSLRGTEKESRDANEKIQLDDGQNHEWASLVHTCIDMTDREYKYKLCLFDSASQEQISGGRSTSLGTWKGWVGEGDNKYSAMKYENGERCWNGPARSVLVELSCGTENLIVGVSEPNRCEYVYRMETPVACTKPAHHEEL